MKKEVITPKGVSRGGTRTSLRPSNTPTGTSEGKKEKCNKKVCDEKPLTKTQINEQNKILKKVFIGVGIFVGVILLGVWFIDSVRHFEYEGVKFNVVKEGELILYNTALPVYTQTGVSLSGHSILTEHTADYNFYLRKDPRKLEYIPFNGELKMRKILVINATKEFDCEGDEIIAIANLVNLYEFGGAQIMTDPNATCDSDGRYMFINLQEGEVSSIEQTGPACYNLNIKACEILEVTEKFMVETFVDIANRKD